MVSELDDMLVMRLPSTIDSTLPFEYHPVLALNPNAKLPASPDTRRSGVNAVARVALNPHVVEPAREILADRVALSKYSPVVDAFWNRIAGVLAVPLGTQSDCTKRRPSVRTSITLFPLTDAAMYPVSRYIPVVSAPVNEILGCVGEPFAMTMGTYDRNEVLFHSSLADVPELNIPPEFPDPEIPTREAI